MTDCLVGVTSVEVREEEKGGLTVKVAGSWRGKGEVLTSQQGRRKERLRVTCGAGRRRVQWRKKLLQGYGCPGNLSPKVRNLNFLGADHSTVFVIFPNIFLPPLSPSLYKIGDLVGNTRTA